jgi:hypothetical protein
MSLFWNLGRTPWFSGTFSYQRLLARTAKRLIGGSEPVLAQLRSAALGLVGVDRAEVRYAFDDEEIAVLGSACVLTILATL